MAYEYKKPKAGKLTDVEVAVKRIKSGIDREYCDFLYDQLRYAFGYETGWYPLHLADNLPYFPELTMNSVEVGVSRTLMNSIQIMVSRLLSSQIGMEVRGVEPIVEEVMESYLQHRMNGSGQQDGGWIEELRAAGMDGNALGVGIVQIGLETDRQTGLQRTTVKRHAPWYCIFDPYTKNLSRSPWVCFVHHLSPEDAIEMGFDEKLVKKYSQSALRTEKAGDCVELVRLYEYFDLGHGQKGKPTRMLILGTLEVKSESDPRVVREENVLDVLPYAVCLGWEDNLNKRPYGRIVNELPHEAARRAAERRVLATLDQPPIAVIDEANINAEDLERYKAGIPQKYLRFSGDEKINANSVAAMLPGGQVSDHELYLLSYTDRQQDKASNITPLERGIQSTKRQTRTETLAVLGSGDANKGFEKFQQIVFVKRFLDKLFIIARKFDRVPFRIEVRGLVTEFNQPSKPESWLGEVIPDHYEILVDEGSMTRQDDDLAASMQIEKLRTLLPYAQAGMIDIDELVARQLDALGESPSDWNVQRPAMPIPQQGGERSYLDAAVQSARQNPAG